MMLTYAIKAQVRTSTKPIVGESLIFEERKGIVAVEAEYFYKQTKTDVRAWYRTTKIGEANITPDSDPVHIEGASNSAYIEVLPDSRSSHSDELKREENFTEKAGSMAVVHYKVKFNQPGRYYVWVRAYSSGSEDNGVHVGMEGEWPSNGKRMQWCDGKHQWTWASMQRTKEQHCGVPHQIFLDVDSIDIHDIQFSMREDGFEMDKFILTNDINYVPTGLGPEPTSANGSLETLWEKNKVQYQSELSYYNTISRSLDENKSIAAQQFNYDGSQFYKNGKNWLAINPKLYQEASVSSVFEFESGRYDLVFVGVGENDGRSTYTVLINDKELGTYSPPLSTHMWEEGQNFNGFWENVKLKQEDKITIIGKVGTEGLEWTRARWAGIVFVPVGKGKQIQDAPSTFRLVK